MHRITSAVLAAVLGLFWQASLVSAAEQITYRSGEDVPLCLAASPDGSRLLVGYSSGRVLGLAIPRDVVRPVWEARANGAALVVLPLNEGGKAAANVLVGTATGKAVRYDAAGKPVWEFSSTCEISSLVPVADVDGDGEVDIAAGGADHRVHLLSGKTGKPLWTHLFESRMGGGYVTRLAAIGDVYADRTRDLAVYLWSGELALLDGRNGSEIRRRRMGMGYMDAMAVCSEVSATGLLVGGNDCAVHLCGGRDGNVLWSGRTQRPVREVVVDGAPGKRGRVRAFACTAGGEVACFEVKSGEDQTPRWTARMDDVCRGAVVVEDLDGDAASDIVAYSEGGEVSAYSGERGGKLWTWRAPDAVRAICPIHVDGKPGLAIASLDGAVNVIPMAPTLMQNTASQPAQQSTLENGRHGGRPLQASAGAGRPLQGAEDPRVIILLYHDVLPEAFYRYGTSVENFRAEMDMLVAEKYACVSLDEIADWIEGKGPMPARAVCITFDGPYQGHYTYAYPILREHGLFATSYITTDWIGTANHADWHQLREMEAAGVMDVQNHTINHAELGRVSRQEVIEQLTGCNAAILRHIGKVARHHAFPSGVTSPAVCGILRELGFRTATTVQGRPVRKQDDPMDLPRYTLVNDTSPERFRTWLTGVGAAAAAPSR